MAKIVYSPTEDGDKEVVETHGVKFFAGRAVPVEDKVFAKLKGNPQFKVAKGDEPEDEDKAPAKPDGRSKAARQAKAAAVDDEAKARAAAHTADLQEAEEEAAAEKAQAEADKAAAEK